MGCFRVGRSYAFTANPHKSPQRVLTGRMSLYPDSLLDAMRQKSDDEADACIADVFSQPERKQAMMAFLQEPLNNESFCRGNLALIDAEGMRKLISLPPWAGEKKMQKGAAFFARHAQPVMNLLALLSLPYCYAAANGARVLSFSGRIKNDVQKRLYNTAGFVWAVMSPDAFHPQGYGYFHLFRTRVMHAAVRYYILRSGNWSKSWGLPINQEDMAGTNLAFSLMAIRGLRKFGYAISYDDQQAFLHLWNVIGYALGLCDALIPQSGKEATELEKAIRQRQFGPSEHGQELALSLVGFLAKTGTSQKFPHKQVLQLMRYLLGNKVADLLALPPQTLPGAGLQLLKMNSLIDALKPKPGTNDLYRAAYRDFRKQKSSLEKLDSGK